MCGANDAEVGAVQGGDACRTEAFSDGDQAGVRSAEGQVLVAAGVVAVVCAIGCSDKGARVNDQQWSVATEPVGEEFVDLVADAVLTRPDPSKRQMPAARRSTDVGDVVGEDFGGEFLDCDPTRRCGCFQAASNVVGNDHGHRHGPSLYVPPAALLFAFQPPAVGS